MRVEAATRSEFSWLKRRTGCALTDDFTAIKAVDWYGFTRGMVGFCGWTENAVQAHIASESAIAWRHLLPFAFRLVFEELDREVMLGLIPAGNPRSLRFATKAGLSERCRIPDGWAKGEALVVLELRKENCRYLTGGQRKAA